MQNGNFKEKGFWLSTRKYIPSLLLRTDVFFVNRSTIS